MKIHIYNPTQIAQLQVGAGVVVQPQTNAALARETAIPIHIALEIWNVELTIVKLQGFHLPTTAVMSLVKATILSNFKISQDTLV